MNILRPLVKLVNETNGDYLSSSIFLKSVLSLQNMVGSTQQETIGFARVTTNKKHLYSS